MRQGDHDMDVGSAGLIKDGENINHDYLVY